MRTEYKTLEIAPGTEYVPYVCKEMTATWAGSVPVGPVPTVRLKSAESAGQICVQMQPLPLTSRVTWRGHATSPSFVGGWVGAGGAPLTGLLWGAVRGCTECARQLGLPLSHVFTQHTSAEHARCREVGLG